MGWYDTIRKGEITQLGTCHRFSFTCHFFSKRADQSFSLQISIAKYFNDLNIMFTHLEAEVLLPLIFHICQSTVMEPLEWGLPLGILRVVTGIFFLR